MHVGDVELEQRRLPFLQDLLVELVRLTFSTTSSIRAGWMRPSAMRRSSAIRAISRRKGSKPERMTASGVSSTIRSTPVAASRARMLRPSRPMMRPFISSLGSITTDTVVSET